MQYAFIWLANCFFVVLHTRCEPAGSRSCAGSRRPAGSARGRSSTGGRSGLGWVKRANYLEGQRGELRGRGVPRGVWLLQLLHDWQASKFKIWYCCWEVWCGRPDGFEGSILAFVEKHVGFFREAFSRLSSKSFRYCVEAYSHFYRNIFRTQKKHIEVLPEAYWLL